MKAEMDRVAPERKKLSEQVRDLENQLEGLRSERAEEIAKLTSEKKALQDRLRDAESQILQLKSAEAGRKRSDEEPKRYATENMTREEIRQSLEDEIRRLRRTVGQTEGEKREKEERIAEYEERIHGMQARLEAYQEYIQSLDTQLREEMSRHAPMYGAGLDALSMTELETISRIHEEGLRQVHATQQQRVGMHHSNGHVNDELKKVVEEKDAFAERLKSVEAGRKRFDEELKRYETENVTREEIRPLEDEIRRLRQTVGQTEGEKREKEERIAEYEERINGMQARLEAYKEYIQSLDTQLREEMSRHAHLYGAPLDALSMTELEMISRIHEEGLRQIHTIQQQRVGMHHSNGHVNDELRQTVGQTEGEEREKEERIAEYEERIHGMQARLEACQEYIQSLDTQLGEEMSRHAPLYGAGLDALSMTELETISRIHEEGLRQIHAIQQLRKGSHLSCPIVSPHMLPPHNQVLYPTAPPQVATGLPPSVMPNGVGMHHSNRHVNGAMGPWFNHK